MAAANKQISILRITIALLATCLIVVSAAGTYMAGMLHGMRREQVRSWQRDIVSAGWSSIATRFAELESVEAFGVLDQIDGNAVSLYWPDGVGMGKSPCGHFYSGPFDSPDWERTTSPSSVMACGRIQTIVQAAHMSRMDLSDWLSTVDPAAAPGSSTWFGVHQGPYEDMKAALARAHVRLQEGDLDGAESDARAVVSAGLQFMRGSADVSGMTLSSMVLGWALDHMRVIAERRGDAVQATRAQAAAKRVADLRRDVFKLSDTAMKAAAMSSQMHFASKLATNPDIPIGLRLHAAVMVGYGGLFNPTEVALGLSDLRQETLEAMAADPVLRVAVARAKEPFESGLRDRIDHYAMTFGVN